MTHPVVLVSDERYAMPLATALRSIVEANRSRTPVEFHVLHDGIPEEVRGKVFESLPKGSASIRWVEVDLGLFCQFSTIRYISKATYARFLIPSIFPDTTSKVLYLDADLIVLDDLGPLWETDLDEAVVGAVLDGLDCTIKDSGLGLVELPRVQGYFNAGVLLINLYKWRKERISQRALEYLALNPNSPYSDQDALNVVCDGRWKKLDPRWNFVDFRENKKISDLTVEQRPGIVHFASSMKPWNASVRNVNASFYDSFRSRTRFARTPKDKLWDMLKSARSLIRSAFEIMRLRATSMMWPHPFISQPRRLAQQKEPLSSQDVCPQGDGHDLLPLPQRCSVGPPCSDASHGANRIGARLAPWWRGLFGAAAAKSLSGAGSERV
jgi:lipopolysaccharide biosynthesis glycosyltransferase